MSPLRWPGGKGRLAPFMADVCAWNNATGTWVEPYAGGAGLACALLLHHEVRDVVLNDLDSGVWAFWHTLKRQPGTLLKAVERFPWTDGKARDDPQGAITYWETVRDRYRSWADGDSIGQHAVDFLYLNRMNVSGIISGGPIGGHKQAGRYTIASRFNREALTARLAALAGVRDHMTITRMDAVGMLDRLPQYGDTAHMMVLLDPPYVGEGKALYDTVDDSLHTALATRLRQGIPARWLLTYDTAPLVARLYAGGWCDRWVYDLPYSVARHETHSEWLITSKGLDMPLSGAGIGLRTVSRNVKNITVGYPA